MNVPRDLEIWGRTARCTSSRAWRSAEFPLSATSVMTSEGGLSAQCGGKTRIENRRGRI
jgi:hypothetical protein